MKFGELRDELALEAGYELDNAKYMQLIGIWIRDVARELFDYCQFLQYKILSIDVVQGQSTYTLSPNVSEIILLRYTDGTNRELRYKPPIEVNEVFRNWELYTQPPTHYWIDEIGAGDTESVGDYMTIHLLPTPDQAYRFEAYVRVSLPDFEENTVVPFPKAIISILKDGVRSVIKDDDGDLDGAKVARGKYMVERDRQVKKHSIPKIKSSRMAVTDVRTVPMNSWAPAIPDWKING